MYLYSCWDDSVEKISYQYNYIYGYKVLGGIKDDYLCDKIFIAIYS